MATTKEIAETVTARIIAELETGTIPWRKPWNVAGLAPTSLQTGKAYRGINHLLLSLVANAEGYSGNYWATYKQAQALGGNVRKGERGTPVVYWSLCTAKPKAGDDDERGRSFMLMKQFTVFNADQCEGIELPAKYARPVVPTWSDNPVMDVFTGYRNAPTLSHAATDRAYYSPMTDAITLPIREAFPTLANYAETAFHEMTHSTGHASRLDRFTESDGPQPFGSAPYAREELVAELGAMMLCSHVGIEADAKNGAAYVASWLKALQDDRSLIITAAQRASKACAHILGESEATPETENA